MDLLESFHLPPFKENAEGSAGVRWKKWLKQFELYLEVKKIEDPELKKTHLLYYGKDDIQKVIEQDDDKVDFVSNPYQRAVRKLNAYYLPKVSRIYERSVFRKIEREPSEKIESFVLRLKKQAEFCEFGEQLEYLIVDQIVEKMQENELKKKIIKGNFTLDEIQNMVSAHEMVQVQIKSYDRKEDTTFINAVQNFKRQNEIECFSCGHKGHRARSPNCPALNKQCGICKKIGHFSSKCYKKFKPSNEYFNRQDYNYDKHSKSKARSSNINNVAQIEEHYNEGNDEIVFNINAGTDIKCVVGGVEMKLLLDTGSSADIIGENEWKQNKNKFVIQEQLVGSDKRFRAYGSKENLKVVGRVKMKIEVDDKADNVWFYIVLDGQRSLLSGKTAENLNLIQMKKNVSFPKLRDVKAFIHIDLSVHPIAQPYRRIPMALESKVIEKLKEMLEQDIIEYVHEPSKWISAMVIVPKKDDLRICIDMRQANKAVLREFYPLPTFEELSHKLRGCTIFSKVDIKQAYHQLELDENCRYITTFITPLGLMRYKRLMFGLSSAPETFQRIMEFITRGLEGVLIYIDDIIVFGSNTWDHDKRLYKLQDRLTYYNVNLNKGKCQFNLNELDFLGFHITANGVQVSEAKIDTINNFKSPKSVDELSSFLGLTSYVSKYIPHLATLSSCLNELTKKGKRFKWEKHHEEAFEKIKEVIGAKETLALFDPKYSTYLFTDASPVGLGAVLVQHQLETYRVCAYASKTLSDTEKRYAQTEKEALAIVWGVERFHFFLFGIKFTIFTDHRPLTYIFNERSRPCLRIERWVLRLQSYSYDIKYVAGKNNIADPCSRLMCDDDSIKNFDECEILIHAVFSDLNSLSLHEIKEATKDDSELQEVVKCLQNGYWTKELWRYKLVSSEISFDGSLLLRGSRIILPKKLQRRAVQLAHEGHLGIVKMKRHLREFVWFPFMDKSIEEYVGDCFGCTLVSSAEKMVPLTNTDLPTKPWEFLAIDFLGPLPTREYVLVIIDYYSRYIEIEIMTSITASNTFKKLRRIFSRFGYPQTIKADYGPQFRDEFRTYCIQYDIKLIHSLPYAPHQNGEVERQNQGILKSIRISQALGRDWKMDLEDYLLMYRSTPHMTTNKSPAELLFGRKIKSRFPIAYLPINCDEELREIDNQNKKKGKERADKKAKRMNINTGDTVVVKKFIKKHKIDPNFDSERHQVMERKGTKVKVKSLDTGIINDRYVGHVKKISSANPFFSDLSSNNDAPEPSTKDNCSSQPTAAELPGQCHDSDSARPKRRTKLPEKMKDYQVYQVI